MKKHLLMCTHNGASFITEQLESILYQDSKIDFYHIFDFASNDRTLELVEKCFRVNGENFFHIYRYPSAPGASLSFFFAFETLSKLVADDDCIFIADQDDVWLKDKVSVTEKIFEKEIADNRNIAIFHDVKVVDFKLKTLEDSFYTGNPYLVPRDLSIDRLLICNPVIGHTLLVSGSALKMVNNEMTAEGYLMHDWAFVLWMSRFGKIVYFPGKILSLYRQHSNNVLGAKKKRGLVEIFLRTKNFSKSVVDQTLYFSADLKRKKYHESFDAKLLDKILIFIAGRKFSKFIICFIFAFLALFRGPTLKRKMLLFFFLMQIISLS